MAAQEQIRRCIAYRKVEKARIRAVVLSEMHSDERDELQ